MSDSDLRLRRLYWSAVATTVSACLGWAGVFTIVGMDLTQAYETNGMLAGYVSSLLVGYLSTITTLPLWAHYHWYLWRSGVGGLGYETL